MRKIYAARYGDGTGARTIIAGFFYSESDALKAVSVHGCYAESPSEYVIYNDLEDYDTNNDEAVKKRAIAKLTDEELRVLGLRRV